MKIAFVYPAWQLNSLLFLVVLYGFMGKSWEYMGIPSGNLTVCELEHGPVEIVD
jgi:hypothetical protein